MTLDMQGVQLPAIQAGGGGGSRGSYIDAMTTDGAQQRMQIKNSYELRASISNITALLQNLRPPPPPPRPTKAMLLRMFALAFAGLAPPVAMDDGGGGGGAADAKKKQQGKGKGGGGGGEIAKLFMKDHTLIAGGANYKSQTTNHKLYTINPTTSHKP